MSSAILYVAIVAIWATVLLPRWLHPKTAVPADAEPTEYAEPAAPAEPEDAAGDVAPQTYEPPGYQLPDYDLPGYDGTEEEFYVPRRVPEPATSRVAEPAPARAPRPEARRDRISAPARRSSRVVRARRRMLGTLLLLTVAACGLAAGGITGPWVVVPPAGILAGFVLLLREAARGDAHRARRAPATAERRSEPVTTRADRVLATPAPARQDKRGRQAPAAAVAKHTVERSADVIDISSRMTEVYDQYADAASRAVGD